MINHTRTLLMNMPGEAHPRLDIVYDAYTPAYAPAKLPTGLLVARTLLFGSSPDYQGMCMRAAQLLSLVAGTPYASHLTAQDPRITYDFTAFNPQRFPEVFVQATDGEGNVVPVSVEGSYAPPAGSGRAVATWAIQWSGGVGVVTGTDTREVTISSATCLALPGSGLTLTTPAAPVAGTWRISHRSMVGSVVDAVDAVLASGAAVSALFPPGVEEPLATYYALTNHAMFPYRAAGVVLALAARTEAYGI